MNVRRVVIFLTVMLALLSCKRSSSGQLVVDVPAVIAAVVLGGGDVLLNPAATAALLVGAIQLRNEAAVGAVNGDMQFTVDCSPGCSAEQSSVVLRPGESATVQIFTTLVLVATISISVFARYVAGTAELAFPIAWNNAGFNSAAFGTLALLSVPVFAVLWPASAVLTAVGVETRQSNPNVPRRIPKLAQDVRQMGAVIGF
ncbi:MAG: hypothetical protein ACI91B_001429 [Planctomycetota bacterium]|jgi:hypothetical protein